MQLRHIYCLKSAPSLIRVTKQLLRLHELHVNENKPFYYVLPDQFSMQVGQLRL
jgi:ATP-dependent helicase/DNAse subunit B